MLALIVSLEKARHELPAVNFQDHLINFAVPGHFTTNNLFNICISYIYM